MSCWTYSLQSIHCLLGWLHFFVHDEPHHLFPRFDWVCFSLPRFRLDFLLQAIKKFHDLYYVYSFNHQDNP